MSQLEREKGLLAQKGSQVEQEAHLALRNEQAAHKEDVDRLQREKVHMKAEVGGGLCGSVCLLVEDWSGLKLLRIKWG